MNSEPNNKEFEVLEFVELVKNIELKTSRSDMENTSELLDKGKV